MPNVESVKRNTDTGRQEQLQFLRFLAFLQIFLYHADKWLFFSYPVTYSCWASVSFFFMLSGLVMGLAYGGKEIRLDMKSVGAFLRRRLGRLYPLYFATTVFMILFSGIPGMIAEGSFRSAGAELAQLLKNIFLVQSWFREGFFSYNGVGWFLSAILFLYALTLPAMAVLNRLGKHPWRYGIYTVLLGGILFLTAAYCYLTQGWDMEYWHYIFPPARAGEYFAGMVLGFMLRAMKPRMRQGRIPRILFTVLEIGVLVFWFRALSSPGNYWRNHIVSWLIPNMAVLCVFTVGAGWVSALFRRPLLARLGNMSFECYLIHQIVILLYGFSNPGLEQLQAGKIVSMSVCLVISVTLAWVLDGSGAKRK